MTCSRSCAATERLPTRPLTAMDILYRKGCLERERDSRAYRYWPTSSREQYAAELMRDALTVSTDHVAALGLVRFVVRDGVNWCGTWGVVRRSV